MSKCKSILCNNEAIAGHDFCSQCIDKYMVAMLNGLFHAVDPEENHECDGCNGCDEEYEELSLSDEYPQYYKDVSNLEVIDVYQVHQLFDVNDPSGAIQHASKKLLLSGVRTGGKSQYDDIREARDTLTRWLEINAAE